MSRHPTSDDDRPHPRRPQAERAARQAAIDGFKPVGIPAVAAALRHMRPLQPKEVKDLPPILRKEAMGG